MLLLKQTSEKSTPVNFRRSIDVQKNKVMYLAGQEKYYLWILRYPAAAVAV